ncbi:hypothetical protein J7337_012970 [Fusarium musae]|uniref:Ankyrin n=1 Tax=Fusarium musae TaxID=1042133 RepID=A0A9P8D6P9_9HYPO|nr:hypothetical protein J7337_012970 [Fusarium musae]KAG9496382.1 hypothetical protein J7337_012970 [Fusarium musae]
MSFNVLDRPIDDVVVVDQPSLTNTILARDVDMVESILSSGADPNARRVGKETPVWRLLDGRRIKPEKQDPNSCQELYPLDLAMTSRSTCCHIAELLLGHGADPNSRYPETTIVHRVLERRGPSPNMVHSKRNVYLESILRHPLLDVNLQDGEGIPLIQTALEVGDAETAQILIDRSADLRCRDYSSRNILNLLSADDCGIGLVQRILALAPDLQYQFDKDGRTPLHYAIDCQKPGNPRDEVKLLIPPGLDGFVKDTIDLLVSKGADINAQNKAGETPAFGYFRGSSFRVDLNWAKLDEERHLLSKKWGGDRWKVNKELEAQIVEET